MDPLTAIESQTRETMTLFRQGYGAGMRMKRPRHKRLVACGMGGSILGAELFQTFAQRILPNLDITIWQTYDLPMPTKRADTDVYCISYSGNTEETLSAFYATRGLRIEPICLARNGILARKAKQTGLTLQILPDTVVPRLVAPFVFGFFVGLYWRNEQGKRAISRATLDMETIASAARKTAAHLAKKHVLLYTPLSSLSLAHLWEIHLNETAGSLAFGDDIPDIDHHTLAALHHASGRQAFRALFISAGKQPARMKLRIAMTQRTLKRIGIPSLLIAFPSKSTLAPILTQAVYASLVAIAIARKTRFNPFTNTIQDTFKKDLRASP